MLEVFSKLDVIKHRTLPLPSRLVLNLNNCYLVLALSIDMIGLCLSQYGYSFKENNGYSVYLNNTFNGLTWEAWETTTCVLNAEVPSVRH